MKRMSRIIPVLLIFISLILLVNIKVNALELAVQLKLDSCSITNGTVSVTGSIADNGSTGINDKWLAFAVYNNQGRLLSIKTYKVTVEANNTVPFTKTIDSCYGAYSVKAFLLDDLFKPLTECATTKVSSQFTKQVTTSDELKAALNSSETEEVIVSGNIVLQSSDSLNIPQNVKLMIPEGNSLTVNGTITNNGIISTPSSQSLLQQSNFTCSVMDMNTVTPSLIIGNNGQLIVESGSSIEFNSLANIITPTETSVLLHAGAMVNVGGKQYIGDNSDDAIIKLSNYSGSIKPVACFFLNGHNMLLLGIFEKAEVLKSDANILDLRLLVKANSLYKIIGELTIPNFDIIDQTNGGIFVEANASLYKGSKAIVTPKDSSSIFNTTKSDEDNRRGIGFSRLKNQSLYAWISGDVTMNSAFNEALIVPDYAKNDAYGRSDLYPTLNVVFQPSNGDFVGSAWSNLTPATGLYVMDNGKWALEYSDATLRNLTVNGETITGFNEYTQHYTVQLPAGTTTIPTVSATTIASGASFVVTTAAAFPGATTVEVTAKDGTTKKTYTINFTTPIETFAELTAALGTAQSGETISLAGSIIVASTETLVIPNNVTIVIPEGKTLTIDGKINSSGTICAKTGSSISFSSVDDIITPNQKNVVLLYAGSNIKAGGKQYIGDSNNALIKLSNFSGSSNYVACFLQNGTGTMLLVINERAEVLNANADAMDLKLLVKAGGNGQQAGVLTIPNFGVIAPNSGYFTIEANASLYEGSNAIITASDPSSVFNATGGDTDNRRGIGFSRSQNGTMSASIYGDVIMNSAFNRACIIPKYFSYDAYHGSDLSSTLDIKFDPNPGDFIGTAFGNSTPSKGKYVMSNGYWTLK